MGDCGQGVVLGVLVGGSVDGGTKQSFGDKRVAKCKLATR
jgi:hypothetical protein